MLGPKGTMSEAKLHILKSRLQGGILNKARRGELEMPLPIVVVPTGRRSADRRRHMRFTALYLPV